MILVVIVSIKGLSSSQIDFRTLRIVVDFIYRLLIFLRRLRSCKITYLTALLRCPLEIEKVKSQGAPQRTARAHDLV